MPATLIFRDKQVYDDGAIVEIKVWGVPQAVPPSTHLYKYSAVYIVRGERVIGFDNERGKGDHIHLHGAEYSHEFRTMRELLLHFADLVAKERARS